MSVFRISYSSDALRRYVNLTAIIPVETTGTPEIKIRKNHKMKTLYLLHGFGGCQDDWMDYTRCVFPISEKREDTFIGGLSMGGFGAMRLGCFYHENFSKIFSFSGAFIIDDISGQRPGYKDMIADYDYYTRTFGDLDKIKGSEKDPLWCLDHAISAGDQPDFYLACGDEDFLLRENRSMREELQLRNVRLEYHESPGSHNWAFWNQYLEKAIKGALESE